MNTQEWALIVFTILSQMAVGSFIVLGIVHFFARRAQDTEAADLLSDRALLAIGPILMLAMLASLLHLGNVLKAPSAVINVESSWLSREILSAVLFTALGGVFAIMQWRKIASFALRNVVALLAAVAGIALVFSMSMVYMLPSQPTWNSLFTPLSFFITTVLLGLFAVGASYVVNYAYVRRQDPDCAEEQCMLMRRSLRWFAVAAVVTLGAQLVVTTLYLTGLAGGGPATVESARLLTTEYAMLLGIRVALAFLGAGVLAVFLYQTAQAQGREATLGNLAVGAFAAVLIAEVIGRYLFYATHVNIGL